MTKKEIVKLRKKNFCQWCWRARLPDSCGLLGQPQDYAVMSDGCPFSQYIPGLEGSKGIIQKYWDKIRKEEDRKRKEEKSPAMGGDEFFKLMEEIK